MLSGLKHKGVMVDTGAMSHIIMDIGKFKKINGTIQPEKHLIKLADSIRASGMALKRGDAEVNLLNCEGKQVKALLMNVLYILSYPQDIFLVKLVTANGASIKFKQGHDELIHKSGTEFNIKEHNRLYYLNTVSDESDEAGDLL